LIKNCSDVPALFHRYLRGDGVVSQGRPAVQVGDKIVEVSPSFRLIMFCRDSAVTLSPLQASFVQRIDFTVTAKGLSGQLLSCAIRLELPQLESEKNALLEKQETLKE